MRTRRLKFDSIHLPWFVLATLACALAFVYTLGANERLVGLDYCYFLPRLIEGRLFFRAQGLAVPWYSPHCGGSPFFANPQSLFYSLPQVLTFFMGAWTAVAVSSFVFVILSAVGMYLVARRIFFLSGNAASLAGIFFAANGFFVTHILVGHLSYQAFALIPLLTFFILAPHIRLPISILLTGLTAAYFVHSGAYSVCLIGALSIALTIALAYLQPACFQGYLAPRSLLLRLFLGSILAVLLSLSKLAAVVSLMQLFPRPMPLDQAPSFLVFMKMLLAQLFLFGMVRPFDYGYWEYANNLNPLAIIGLLALPVLPWHDGDRPRRRAEIVIPLCIAGAVLVFTLLLVAGHPSASTVLGHLGLGALRRNPRFTAVLVMPLILLAARGLDSYAGRVARLIIVPSAVAASLALILIYHGTTFRREELRYNAGQLLEYDRRSLSEAVGALGPLNAGPGLGLAYPGLIHRLSVKNCYEPLFHSPETTQSVNPLAQTLWTGKINEIRDGRFNLLNPACLLFPAENGCSPGDRILTGDEENLKLLLEYRNPHWALPFRQVAAGFVSKYTLFLCCFLLCWLLLPLGRRSGKAHSM